MVRYRPRRVFTRLPPDAYHATLGKVGRYVPAATHYRHTKIQTVEKIVGMVTVQAADQPAAVAVALAVMSEALTSTESGTTSRRESGSLLTKGERGQSG